MRFGLHMKVMVILTFVLLPVVVVTGYVPFKNESSFLKNQGRHRAQDLMRALEVIAFSALRVGDHELLNRFVRRTYFEENEVLSIEIRDTRGKSIISLGPREAGQTSYPETLVTRLTRGSDFVGEVELTFDLARAHETLERTRRLIILSVIDSLLCLGFVLHLALKHLVSRRVLRLRALSHRLSLGELGATIPVEGADELSDLTAAFNSMSGSLEESRREIGRVNQELEERVDLRTAQLNAEKLKSESIVQNLPDGLITFDSDFNIQSLNPAAARLLSIDLDSVVGKKCFEVIQSEVCQDRCLHVRARSSGKPAREEDVTFSTPEGPRPVTFVSGLIRDPAGQLVGGVETFRDIGGLKELHRRLRHSDRLSAVGTLAAGIAHELNNPIGNISTFAQLVRENPEPDTTFIRRSLDKVLSETRRASQIISQLLDFSRSQQLREDRVDLEQLVDEALRLVHSGRPVCDSLIVETICPATAPFPRGDAQQLLQVFINLYTNAIHAMGGTGRLTTRVETHLVRVDERPFVKIQVMDTGPGIDPEMGHQIFDPFFTTKDVGQGTGLGLAIAHRIVEDHGGILRYESEPGQGTTFTLLLTPFLTPSPTGVQRGGGR